MFNSSNVWLIIIPCYSWDNSDARCRQVTPDSAPYCETTTEEWRFRHLLMSFRSVPLCHNIGKPSGNLTSGALWTPCSYSRRVTCTTYLIINRRGSALSSLYAAMHLAIHQARTECKSPRFPNLYTLWLRPIWPGGRRQRLFIARQNELYMQNAAGGGESSAIRGLFFSKIRKGRNS